MSRTKTNEEVESVRLTAVAGDAATLECEPVCPSVFKLHVQHSFVIQKSCADNVARSSLHQIPFDIDDVVLRESAFFAGDSCQFREDGIRSISLSRLAGCKRRPENVALGGRKT